VETETPVRHLRGGPRELGVLLSNNSRLRRRPREEVKVEDAAHDIVFQCRTGGRGRTVVDFDVHAVRVEQEDAVCAGRTVLKVDWVVAVQVRGVRDLVVDVLRMRTGMSVRDNSRRN
jgi:hypothetical protein